MKVAILALLFSLGTSEAFAKPAKVEATPDLVIYSYDSISGKHGLARDIVPLFQKQCGCKIKLVAVGDAIQIVNRLSLDQHRAKPEAHIALGLDQNTWERAKEFVEPWGDWKPDAYAQISDNIKIEDGFLPFDYGVFAFMADTKALKELNLDAPTTLKDLLKPEYSKQFILEDPRLSTPGLAFLVMTQANLKGDNVDFWKQLSRRWLTLAGGWDQGYKLFLKGEAPLVWSYTTSEAYHRDNGDTQKRYRAIILKEAHPVQVEGAVLVKNPTMTDAQKKWAKDFLNFLTGKEIQNKIPRKNWMMPARNDLHLPPEFENLPKPTLLPLMSGPEKGIDSILMNWKKAVASVLD